MKCVCFDEIVFFEKQNYIIIDERKGKQLILLEFLDIFRALLVVVKMLLKLTRISEKSSNTYYTTT